ncbi:hypothetical protein QBC37DRAFT_417905 [Rhypophila decipiens]|uniref:NADH dehydrogenase subunit 1 n=1 Tax=Rhypophila decipiens TaxID=261697 RepID=A0AAN6YG49_9PEZI|nr:hypothetical protein QBC37DRAFT_417905 [Rhypophila decipiens]
MIFFAFCSCLLLLFLSILFECLSAKYSPAFYLLACFVFPILASCRWGFWLGW